MVSYIAKEFLESCGFNYGELLYLCQGVTYVSGISSWGAADRPGNVNSGPTESRGGEGKQKSIFAG